jgi:phosphoribosylamine---glycine ligase
VRVLIVGSGGREHALAWVCRRDAPDTEVIVAPGNGGTAAIAQNVAVDVEDGQAVAQLAVDRAVDLVVIGPDAAAAAGVADACTARGVLVFGPTAAAARIESSKTFAKQVMDTAGVPTARWVAGGAGERRELSAFVAELGGSCVVKADGLALGKGVLICDTVDDAERALDACLASMRFGDAGSQVVVEERLTGPEVSVFGLSDGWRVRTLVPARDHKRIFDGDRGPNTGGMGSIAPPPDVTGLAFAQEVSRTVLEPCVDALRERGTPFVGCLYAGLMLTDSGIRVLEFNARFGDPETQVVLPRLESPLSALLLAAATGGLGKLPFPKFSPDAAVIVVLASEGYPEDPVTGRPIRGLDAAAQVEGVTIAHAATLLLDGEYVSTGGRVLGVVARGADFTTARTAAYDAIGRISLDGSFYRTDIAERVAK